MPHLHDLTDLTFRNILVVDDEPSIHEMYDTLLSPEHEEENTFVENGETMVDTRRSAYNFDLHHADSGENALSICKSQSHRNSPVQMAFVDMRMEGWDGIETIQQLNDFDPRMSFIIVTGFADHTRDEVNKRLGAIALQIFSKPVQMDELYNAAFMLTKRWNRLHGDN